MLVNRSLIWLTAVVLRTSHNTSFGGDDFLSLHCFTAMFGRQAPMVVSPCHTRRLTLFTLFTVSGTTADAAAPFPFYPFLAATEQEGTF